MLGLFLALKWEIEIEENKLGGSRVDMIKAASNDFTVLNVWISIDHHFTVLYIICLIIQSFCTCVLLINAMNHIGFNFND